MKTETREWWLFGVMAALIVAVVAVAWSSVPELAPPAVIVNHTETGAEPSAASREKTGLLSLNTATAEELMTLSGLGEKTAQKILDWRDRHGGFSCVEELLQVEGVGEKKLAAWEPYLTV